MILKRILDKFDIYSKHAAIAGGWALVALSLYIGIDVVGRKLFSLSLQGSDEIGGYVLAVICAAGFSYTLSLRAHIRLNALLTRFPGRLQSGVNLLAYALLLLLAAMLFWRCSAMLLETIEFRAVAPTPLETPLWIPQGLFALGLLWFFLHVATCFGYALYLFTNGRHSELNNMFGVETDKKNN